MAASTDTPLEISGYLIFPLSLPPLPSFPTAATHFLYLAKHEPKIPTVSTSRSLFLVNVPFDATDAHIKRLFSTQLDLPSGRIEDVKFEGEKVVAEDMTIPLSTSHTPAKKGKKRKRPLDAQKRPGIECAELPTTWDRQLKGFGRSAVVVFVDQASLDAVIRAVNKSRKDKKEPVWGEGLEESIPSLGPSRMCCYVVIEYCMMLTSTQGYLNHQRLQYPNKTQLLESVNSFMTAYAAQEASQARLHAKKRQEPDEDGFITVTKGGRNGPARLRAAQELAEKQKVKRKGYEDFYRFQTREKRKAKAVELIRKFEEDKQKLRILREKRAKLKVNAPTRHLMISQSNHLQALAYTIMLLHRLYILGIL